MNTNRKWFWTGVCFAMILVLVALHCSGCAASQGYHKWDAEDGYPVKPGSDSGEISYNRDNLTIEVKTANAVPVINAVSNTDLQHRYMTVWEECQRFGRCSMNGYNMYSYPGWGPAPMTPVNPSASQAANQSPTEQASECKTPADACARANAALGISKDAGRAVLDMAKRGDPKSNGGK